MENFGEDDEYVSRMLEEDDSVIKCLYSLPGLYSPLYKVGLYKNSWAVI